MTGEHYQTQEDPERLVENIIDADIDAAESEPVVNDAADLVRSVIDDLLDEQSLFFGRALAAGHLKRSYPDSDSVRAYYAWDYGFDIETKDSFIETPSRRIIPVQQCKIWDVKKSKRHYFWASMSECSFLVGPTEHGLVAAHLGYGEVGQLNKAHGYMTEAGVDFSRAKAIINNNPKQNYADQGVKNLRHAELEDYLEIGMSTENIHGFTYLGMNDSGHKGLVQLIATPEYIFQYSLDLEGDKKSSYYNDLIIPTIW